MSQVVEQLAALTADRDRDVVDATLASALRDLLQPRQVAVYRSVGDAGDERWLNRARLGLHDAVAVFDPPWAALHTLPPLQAHPARLQALQQHSVVIDPGPPHATLFPLAGDGGTTGVLELWSEAPLQRAELRLVDSILRIYRNFQALLDDNERDTLTGLLNRKTFDASFYKLTAGAAAAPAPAGQAADERRSPPPAEQPYFIGVIDIDHFKAVNDQHGHLIGDEVLLLLSRLMRSVFRFHDRLYRFGGEEFVVLMRCSGDAQAGQALQRLREQVHGFVFPQVGTISVSIGYTGLRPNDTPSTAFDRADRAVYWAKAQGRNRVASHAALVAAGALAEAAKPTDGVGDVELF